MKNTLFVIACFIATHSLAQFQIESTFFGETTGNMRAISIGNVTNPNQILSRLHVNNFRCNLPAGTFNGLLLRTDGDQSVDNRWQLFTGTTADAQTERFRIRTLAGGFDTWIERTQPGSEADIRLLTAQIEIRARNKRLGNFCEMVGPLADINSNS